MKSTSVYPGKSGLFWIIMNLIICFSSSLFANTYNVTSTTDFAISGMGISVNSANGMIIGGPGNGQVTVRSAIAAANSIAGPHTINVPAGTYNLTIAGTGEGLFPAQIDIGDLDVTANNVTIHGVGMNSTIINQTSGIDRVFDVNVNFIGDFNFTIDNLTISGGREQTGNGGGGMFTGSSNNLGTVTITNVKFDNNQAFQAMGFLGSGFGGGGLQHQGGHLMLSGCIFNNNSTTKSGGGLSACGFQDLPIMDPFVVNNINVTNCTFTNNTCNGASGGGAIDFFAANLTDPHVFVNSCSFSNNVSTASSGGAIVNESAQVAISECTFLNNQGTAGGALHAGGDTTSISFCRFIGNTATTGKQLSVAGASILLTANNNWWGVNTGPGVNDAVALGGATLILTNWLQLRHTASPPSVVVSPPGSTTLTASFLTNSANQAIAPADLGAIIGLPITFNNAFQGSLSAAQTTIQSTGTATATYTVFITSCPPSGSADATVDNQTTTATITIIDNLPPDPVCNNINAYLIPPTYTFPPADSAAIVQGTIESCGLTTTFNPSSLNCMDIGPNIITVTYTDDAGNTASCTATVTLLDTIPPMAICQDVTVSLDANGMGSTTAVAVDNGSSDGCGIQSLMLSETDFDCSELASNQVVLTVTDNNGNTATCSANVQVVDMIAPTIMCPGDQLVYADEDCQVGLPDFRSLASSDDNCEVDTIIQTPAPGTIISDPGISQLITFTALDETGNSGQCTFNVTLQDTTAPVAMCQDVSINLDAMGNATLLPSQVDNNSSDNCGIDTMSVSPSMFTCNDVGQHIVTLIVEDESGNSATCTATVTVEDIPPVAICQDVTVNLNAEGMGSTTAEAVNNGSNDGCGIQSISLSETSFICSDIGSNQVILTVTDINGNSSTCSANVLVVDPIAPTITCPASDTLYADAGCDAILPDYTMQAMYDDNCPELSVVQIPAPGTVISGHGFMQLVSLTVTDPSGNSSFCTFDVTVQDTTPPAAVCADITIQLDAQGMATISAADVGSGSSDNCGIIGMQVTQTLFTCDDFGDNTVTLTVTDVAGNTSTCSANVHVEDPFVVCCDLPVAECQDVTVYVDEMGNAIVTAEQVDDGSFLDCGLDTMIVSPDAFDCDDLGDNTVVLSIIDLNGNVASCSAIVTVLDTIAPVIECPMAITTECGPDELPAADPGLVIATDNCGDVSVSWAGDVFVGTCPVVVTRLYLAEDDSGNFSVCTQIITIEDTTPPTISCSEDEIACDDRTCLTFENIDVDPLGTPIVINEVVAGGVTVTVKAKRKGNLLMNATLYNSDQPIADPDLGTPNILYGGPGENELDPDGFNASNNQHLSRLLIIQDPAYAIPNDHILSDSLCFIFSEPVYVAGLTTVDFEVEQIISGAGVFMYDENGGSRGFVPLDPALGGDNSMQNIYLNTFGVIKLVVYYGGIVPSSGGVGNLCFTRIPTTAGVTDICSTPEYAYTESFETFECFTNITRVYNAIDDCGNTSSATCVITLFGDYDQPDIMCPSDITIGCEDELPQPDPGSGVATDNCSNGGTAVEWVEDIVEGSGCNEVIRRVYRAFDDCGNEAYCVQLITREEQMPQLLLTGRVYVEAAMAGEQMDARLNDMGYLPHCQPYNMEPFNYSGTEECADLPATIVDWVLVQLRDVITMEVIMERAGLVTEAGDIVNMDGISPLNFEVTGDWYYISVLHRNHMGIVTDLPMDCTGGELMCDFTEEHGLNEGQVEISEGVFAMMCGDVNGDHVVKYNGSNNDKNAILEEVGILTPNNVVPGYNRFDVNMDGVVKYNGSNNDKNALLGIVGITTPNNVIIGPLYE